MKQRRGLSGRKRRDPSKWPCLPLLLSVLLILLSLPGCRKEEESPTTAAKPVIYLYPEETTDVTVRLDYTGELTCTYPLYDEEAGWMVTARPDGILTDKRDGKEYSYLFWEGKDNFSNDFSKDFVVKGSDTAAFLQEILKTLGMTPREYNEFIVYWLPQMEDNAYNLISFRGENYEEAAKLLITPEPDSVLRVFMAWKPLSEKEAGKYSDLEPQKFEAFHREGFTVVEWGGTEVR